MKQYNKPYPLVNPLVFCPPSGTIHTLITVGHVEKQVLVMMLLIYSREWGAGWGKGVVDEEEESLLWSQRHTLTDEEAQLAHC